MKFTEELLLLFLIIILGIFLRFYRLGEIPSGLYVDEAVTGYNAYSILQTGKDEYGKAFPVAFRFFGSYSPPIYTYLTSVAIRFNELSIYSIRFTSAIFGVIGTILLYLFLKNLNLGKNKSFALIGGFIFAISPWSVFFSRVGYELNLGATILFAGILLFWLGLKKPMYLVFSLTVLSLSTYGAHPERFLVPILGVTLLFFYKKELFSKKLKKYTILGILLAFVIQIPNIYLFSTSAFNTKEGLFFKDALVDQSKKVSHFLPSVISYQLSFTREYISRYTTYFSPRSLFFLEDPDAQRSAPELSLFYSWMVFPYLLGLYLLWQKRKGTGAKFLFILLLTLPLPLALTSDPFSSQRGLHLIFPLIVVITLGVDYLIHKWKSRGILLFIFLSFISLVYLWRSYFVLLPHERAKIWGYGFRQLAEETSKRPDDLFLIDQSRIKPIYIELAFFLGFPPEKLQESVDKDIAKNYYSNTSFKNLYKFSNIEIRNIDWERDVYKKQILVGDELSISEGQAKEHFLTKVFEIDDPTGMIVFVGFMTNPEKKCFETQNQSVYCNDIRWMTYQR